MAIDIDTVMNLCLCVDKHMCCTANFYSVACFFPVNEHKKIKLFWRGALMEIKQTTVFKIQNIQRIYFSTYNFLPCFENAARQTWFIPIRYGRNPIFICCSYCKKMRSLRSERTAALIITPWYIISKFSSFHTNSKNIPQGFISITLLFLGKHISTLQSTGCFEWCDAV